MLVLPAGSALARVWMCHAAAEPGCCCLQTQSCGFQLSLPLCTPWQGQAGLLCSLPQLMACARCCSHEKLAFNESHRGRVLGILPVRVSYLKLEIRFFFSFLLSLDVNWWLLEFSFKS